MINGTRIKQAREIRAMSVADLAAWVEVSEQELHHMEANLLACQEPTLERLALRLGFPMAFFRQGDPPAFSEGSMIWH